MFAIHHEHSDNPKLDVPWPDVAPNTEEMNHGERTDHPGARGSGSARGRGTRSRPCSEPMATT